MSRAAGPALGVRRPAFKWIVSECSLTRLGPSKVLVNTRRLGGVIRDWTARMAPLRTDEHLQDLLRPMDFTP